MAQIVMIYLVLEEETKDNLSNIVLTDEFFKRWVNKHLKFTGRPKAIDNFEKI